MLYWRCEDIHFGIISLCIHATFCCTAILYNINSDIREGVNEMKMKGGDLSEEGECPVGTFNFFFPFPLLRFFYSFTLSLFYAVCYREISTHSSSMEEFSTNIFLSYNLEFFYDSHFQVRESSRQRKKWKSFDVKLSPLITHYLLVCDSIFYMKLSFSLVTGIFRSMHCRREWCVIETAFVWHWSGKLSFSSHSLSFSYCDKC